MRTSTQCPPGQPLIQVCELYKCYWVGAMPYPALNGVDLSVHPGELVVLAGRSGSGKSTLLNVVGTLEEADAGEVLVCGRNVSTWNARQRAEFRLRHLGFVFQAYNLIRVLTARENVAYVCQLQGRPRPECLERADYWLEQVGIGYLGYRRPDQLSGGQQQRVAVARARATHPEQVVADEPTANVDSRTGRELVELLQGLNGRFGTTLVIASHDPAVLAAAGRLVQIEDGHIAGPGQVYRPPRPQPLACPKRNQPWRHRLRDWWRQRRSR
jgi:putative ABC transport system ATP-binding protein